jgi:cytochrome c oxidase subunit 1
MLWMHFFWIVGHPEVYILIIPCFAFMSEIIPVFSRKPIFGYPVMVAATVCIGFVSMSVWAHHMFSVGMSSYTNSFFTITTMAVGVPTGIKIFNWLGTMWGGRIQFKTPMLFCIAFLFQFLIAGLTGVMLGSAAFASQLTLSYFVVAHFHYTLVGGVVSAVFAAIYYWYPKITGRMLNETLGKVHFWLFVIGFHLTFDLMHFPGLLGMPRRIYTYEPGRGWDTLNLYQRRRVHSGDCHPGVCGKPPYFLFQGRQGRQRSLGRMDARMVHQFAAARVQLCFPSRGREPPAVVGPEASRRSGQPIE